MRIAYRVAAPGILTVAMASALTAAALAVAPAASAACENVDGVVICGQGDTYGVGRSSVPNLYPCDNDWYCDQEELGVIFQQPGNDSGADSQPNPRNRPNPN